MIPTRAYTAIALPACLMLGLNQAPPAQTEEQQDSSAVQWHGVPPSDPLQAQEQEQPFAGEEEDPAGQQDDSAPSNEAAQWGEAAQDEPQEESDEQAISLSPTGWVRVATDYDNDGNFDTVETMYLYDLEIAQESSRSRDQEHEHHHLSQEQYEPETESQSQTQRYSGQQFSSTQPGFETGCSHPHESVTGSIQEIRYEQLAGMPEQCLIARISSDEGRSAKACLGPQSQLSRLDLQEGSRLTVEGVRGHINDKSMLIACQVSSAGEQVTVNMPPSRHLKRVHGEILRARLARFRGYHEPYVVAQVRTRDGQRELVNLGPRSKVRELDVQEGDQIAMLVRPGLIDGRPAMIAEQLHARGRLVDVTQPGQGDPFGGSSARAQGRAGQSVQQPRERITYDGTEQAVLGVLLSETDRGVQIERILPEGPAAESDLRAGDQLVSINGAQIQSYRDVVRTLSDYQPNESVDIRARRNGQELTANVRLGARSDLLVNRGWQY